MISFCGGYNNNGNVNIVNCVIIFNISDNKYLITWLIRNIFLHASGMHDVLMIFNARNGASVLTLRVYHPLSYVTRIDEVTFLSGHHDGLEMFWKVSGDFLSKFSASNKHEYSLYERFGIVMPIFKFILHTR